MVRKNVFLLKVSLLIFILFSFLNAQTDPNANPNWDWRNGDNPSVQYPASLYTVYSKDGANIVEDQIDAPWSQPNATDILDDNKPEDGWVLVARDFGTPTRAVLGPYIGHNPYFILYNKYKSKMRTFIYVAVYQTFTENGGMILQHVSGTKTCVLTHLKPRAYATDKLDVVGNNIATGLTDIVGNNYWVWSDYPMAFDPTIVPSNVRTGTRLKHSVIGTEESSIKVTGDLIGVSGEEDFVRKFMTDNTKGPVTITDGASSNVGSSVDLGAKLTGVIGNTSSWSGWKKTLDNLHKSLPQYENTDSNPFKSASNLFKDGIGLLKDNWVVESLPGIGFVVGLVDFFIGGGSKTAKATPTYIGQKITLTGTIETTFKLTSEATIPVPSSRIDPTIPTLGTSVPLLYNNKLGLLNLTETPTIKYKTYYQYVGGGLSHQYGDFQISEDLEFAFNDLNNLGLKLDSISAWIQMDVTDVVNKTSPTTDKDLNLLASWTLQEFPKMETELLSNEIFIFRTRPIDASHLKYQTIQGRITDKTPDVTLKIKAVFSRLDDPDAIPIVQVITYEPELVSDGTGNWPKAPIVVKVTRKFEGGDEEVLPIEYSGQDEDLTIITPSNIGSYIFVGWSNGSFNNSYTFENSQSVSANYKLIAHSNTATAYQNNGQRKILQTESGTMFRVYESLNKIWLEKSTNDGSTWVLANNGQPISYDTGGGTPASSPSIGIAPHNDVPNHFVMAVCYLLSTPSQDALWVVRIDANGNILTDYTGGKYERQITSCSELGEPVIAVNYLGKINIVFKRKNDILRSILLNAGLMTLKDLEAIPNSDNSSSHPTISSDVLYFHLAWQQNVMGGSNIRYTRMKYINSQFYYSHQSVPSNSPDYDENLTPSITCYNERPTVSWVNIDEDWVVKRVYVRRKNSNGTWGTTTSLTNYTPSTDIIVSVASLSDDYHENEYILGYAADYDKVVYYLPEDDDEDYLYPNNYDDYVQVCNSEESWGAVFSTFKTNSSPYALRASRMYGNLSKTSTKAKAIKGRELILTKGSSNLKIKLETPTVDDIPIDFVEIDDTTAITSKEEALSLFTTKEFELNNKSDFLFNLKYVETNKSEGKKGISADIKLNLVLLDAKTNQQLGVLKEVSNKKVTEKDKEGMQYRVNTKGIGNRAVKLLIELDPKTVDDIVIVKTSNLNKDDLKKENQIEVALDKDLMITDYALSQNYPNPFNPSTTIKYQIPNDGMVSLKIYDITGQEVKTLVNQAQTMGRYEVNFDASNLSSGVYLYRLQSGSFAKSIKMLLLK